MSFDWEKTSLKFLYGTRLAWLCPAGRALPKLVSLSAAMLCSVWRVHVRGCRARNQSLTVLIQFSWRRCVKNRFTFLPVTSRWIGKVILKSLSEVTWLLLALLALLASTRCYRGINAQFRVLSQGNSATPGPSRRLLLSGWTTFILGNMRNAMPCAKKSKSSNLYIDKRGTRQCSYTSSLCSHSEPQQLRAHCTNGKWIW